MQDSQTPPKFKRRNKLPKPRFQLRWAATFMALVALSLFVQTLVCGAQIASFARDFQGSDADLMEALPGVLGRSLLYGSLFIVPALGAIAIQITFRMAGPIYRFETHLRAVAAGESPGVCRIRDGDHHVELCELINAALLKVSEPGKHQASERTDSSGSSNAA